jgi:hypothetical protein
VRESGASAPFFFVRVLNRIVPSLGMKLINGTSYHDSTPDAVIRVLESARLNRTRLHISFGDPDSGRDWLEEFESHGYVGRSTGPVKVPLILATRRSVGATSSAFPPRFWRNEE